MRARVSKIPLLLSVIIGEVAIITTASVVVVATETIDIPTNSDNNNNDVGHLAPQVVPQLNAHKERSLLRDPKTVVQKTGATNSLRRQDVVSALDDISVQQHSLEDSIADSIAANTALALVTEVEDSILN